MFYFNFGKVLLRKVIRYSCQFIYFLLYISFNISRYHFHNFLKLHSTLSQKDFSRKFSFLNGFTQLYTPNPLSGQNLLSVTKFFCQFSLRWPLKHFFGKNLLIKSCKSIFYESVVNCYYHYIFKGSNYRFSDFLFRTYFKNSYFDTSISNYL